MSSFTQPIAHPGTLPPLDAIAAQHSRELAATIRLAIDAAGGRIDFAQFMNLALYEPRLGYYTRGAGRIGAHGDFVTAPELGDLFGRCLARQCEEYLAAHPDGQILEIGAGSGRLAAQVLRELTERECLPAKYRILELSPSLRRQQRAELAEAVPELAGRIEWLDGFPDDPVRGVVIANEVLDAMPVTRFRVASTGLQQCLVGYGDGGFHWDYAHFRSPPRRLLDVASSHGLAEGYVSELNDRAAAWTRSLGSRLEHGLVLLIDYGFPAREFYHPQRDQGTLMCHDRHRAHSDPLIHVGVQDITAHVDFSAIAAAARETGLDILGYCQLAPFLLSLGLTDMVPEPERALPRRRLDCTAEVKKLTLPTEMGELFKVLAVGRGVDWPPRGFSLIDHRDRL